MSGSHSPRERRPAQGGTLLLASIACLLTLALPGAGASSTAVVDKGGASASASNSAYSEQVLADGPRSYWRLGETSGTSAADVTGANGGTYGGGVTLGQPGALTGDPDHGRLVRRCQRLRRRPRLELAGRDRLGHARGLGQENEVRSVAGRDRQAGKRPVQVRELRTLVQHEQPGGRLFRRRRRLCLGCHARSTRTGTTSLRPYDNATAKLYVDGTLAAQATSTIRLTANTLPLNMARSNSGSMLLRRPPRRGGPLRHRALGGPDPRPLRDGPGDRQRARPS